MPNHGPRNGTDREQYHGRRTTRHHTQYCFKCNQPGRYATQCPTTDREKASTMNNIMADVQHVTTRSKTQSTQWQVQDEVRQAAKEWIDTANKTNIERMQDITIGAPQSTQPSTLAEDDHLWDAFTNSRISLPLHKLLPLLPRFRDTLATLTSDTKSATPPINLTDPRTGPPLMDSQNPVVKIMIKGRDLHGCIIDGGSDVNVINEATCHNLGLNQWEPCPLLASNGRYALGSPNRVNPPPPLQARRPHVHDLGNSIASRSPRSIPNASWKTLAMNNQY